MAYSTPWNTGSHGEEIPPSDVEPRTLVHDDLHLGNVLFGRLLTSIPACCPFFPAVVVGGAIFWLFHKEDRHWTALDSVANLLTP